MQSERFPLTIFGGGLAFLTVWTIGIHLATFNALPFATLYGVLALALIASLLGAKFASALGPVFFASGLQLPTIGFKRPAAPFRARQLLFAFAGLGVLFAVTAAIQYFTSNFTPLYAVCLASSALALALSKNEDAEALLEIRSPAPAERTVPMVAPTLLVIGLMLAFYFFTAIPDQDDSLLLNLAVGAKRERDALFTTDTMLGMPEAAFFKSTYRLESYPLLAAVISDLSGLSVIHAAHSVIPALICVFSASVLVLIHAALFRKAWLVTVLFHLAWLIALDGTFQSYGYHAIPRFIHGKGPFVTVMVPLIAFLTVVAVCNRKWLVLLLLGCAQIVALGFTANAIYSGPLTSALVAAPLFLLGDRARRLACLRLILTILYPAALAVILLLFNPPDPSEAGSTGKIGLEFWGVFGANYAHAAALLLMFAAASAAWLHRNLRAVSLYTMVLLVVVLNPFTWEAYGRFVTGDVNYRLFWAVPIPLILAILSGLVWTGSQHMIRTGLVVVMVVALLVPGSILHKVDWGLSFRKVEPTYAIAREVNALWHGAGLILAPDEISAWITTLDEGGAVVEGRSNYIPQRKKQIPPEQYALRQMLMNWVSDENADRMAVEQIITALHALDVRVVATRTGTQAQKIMERHGRDNGFNTSMTFNRYRVFVR